VGVTGVAINSVVSDGVIVSGAIVRNCILSPGVYVHSYSVVESSILMGGTLTAGNLKETIIGRYCKIRNAIIDKNVTISAGTVLGYNRHEDEARGLTLQEMRGTSDYIVAVPKNYVL